MARHAWIPAFRGNWATCFLIIGVDKHSAPSVSDSFPPHVARCRYK